MQTFQHPVEKTTVTEGWQPNIDLLKRTLVSQGVTLYPDSEEAQRVLQAGCGGE